MARKNLRRTEALQREERAWELRSHGWTQERIAKDLGVSQPAVSQILARAWDRTYSKIDHAAAQRRYLSSMQLEHLFDEAMQAWERSKLPRKRSSQRRAVDGGTGGGGESATVTTTEAVEQTGDTAYYRSALEAWDRYCKLWGLDAPPKLAIEDDSQPGSVSTIASSMVASDKEFDELIKDEPSNDVDERDNDDGRAGDDAPGAGD